jgi:hypothetical protein
LDRNRTVIIDHRLALWPFCKTEEWMLKGGLLIAQRRIDHAVQEQVDLL